MIAHMYSSEIHESTGVRKLFHDRHAHGQVLCETQEGEIWEPEIVNLCCATVGGIEQIDGRRVNETRCLFAFAAITPCSSPACP